MRKQGLLFAYAFSIIVFPAIVFLIIRIAGAISASCFSFPPKNSVDYLFYKIGDIYVVETCVENLKFHFIQFSRSRDILDHYKTIGKYDLLAYRVDNAAYNPAIDKTHYNTFAFNSNNVNTICVDQYDNTVYYIGLWGYAHDFRMLSINPLISPYSEQERSFEPRTGMTVFSFPAKNGHIQQGSEKTSFSFLGHTRETMSGAQATSLNTVLANITDWAVAHKYVAANNEGG